MLSIKNDAVVDISESKRTTLTLVHDYVCYIEITETSTKTNGNKAHIVFYDDQDYEFCEAKLTSESELSSETINMIVNKGLKIAEEDKKPRSKYGEPIPQITL